ncbi:MAG TPA: hypothetical protein VN950_19145 [Terriglobales bacterium]|nr:hypothetical protein [Terriglobales bacterium]
MRIILQPPVCVGTERWGLAFWIIQKGNVAEGEARLNLASHLFRGFAGANAPVLASSVVVHVHVPLGAALFNLHAHQFVPMTPATSSSTIQATSAVFSL